jgi:D-inositol-3-phosphate glycosyltransferase
MSNKPKQKILVYEAVGAEGGMGFFNDQYCSGLQKNGFDVYYFGGKVECTEKQSYRSFEHLSGLFTKKGHLRKILILFHAVLKLTQVIISQRIRMANFHIFHIGPLEFFLSILLKILGVKLIITLHDVESIGTQKDNVKLKRLVYSMVSRIVVLSNYSKKILESKENIKGGISVINHGNYLDYSRIRDGEGKAIWHNDSNLKILFLGKIKKVKRLDLLISALGKMNKKGLKNYSLIIAGKPHDVSESEVHSYIMDAGLEAHVDLKLRYISDSEMLEIIESSDFAVLPYEEIFQSGVLLLCMSKLLPVITSDIEGFLEVIEPEKNGIVFRSGNENDLENKIEMMINNRELRESVANQAYKTCQGKYDWGRISVQAANVFHSLLDSGEA